MASSKPTKENIHAESHFLFLTWRSYDLTSSIFALMGLLTGTLDYELNYSTSRSVDNCSKSGIETENFRYGTLVLSLVAMVLLCFRHHFKLKWIMNLAKIEGISEKEYKIKHKSMLFKRKIKIFFEFLLLSIFPYPGLNADVSIPLRYNHETILTCYKLTEILYCIMFLRFYLLLRAIISYSVYQSDIARILCQKIGVESGFFFIIKCLIVSRPVLMIAIIGMSSMIITAACCRIFERVLDDYTGSNFGNPFNAIWFIFETIGTLGYGEFIPITYFARVVAVIAWLVGSIVLGLTISSLQSNTELTKKERDAYEKIVNHHAAVDVLKCMVRYHRIIKKFGKNNSKAQRRHVEIKKSAENFKNIRMNIHKKTKDKKKEFFVSMLNVETVRSSLKDCHEALNGLIGEYKEDGK